MLKVRSLSVLSLVATVFLSVPSHACFLGFGSGCDKKAADAEPVDDSTVEVRVLYGSEKDGDHGSFLPALAKKFMDQKNADGGMVLDASGKKYKIRLKMAAEGSEAALQRIMNGEPIALFAPASQLQIMAGNYKKRMASANKLAGEPMFSDVQEVYNSPVVIAMLDYMVDTLKTKSPNPGWKDIFKLSQEGWKAYGAPSYGQFRWGHTHPNYSNSGRMSVLAEAYAAIMQKNPKMSQEDVWSPDNIDDPSVGTFINSVEQSIQFYGKSTGFYTQQMGVTDKGPTTANGERIKSLVQLQAAVTYESDLLQLNANLARNHTVGCKAGTGIDASTCTLVPIRYRAIYPSEGVMWATHPFAIVNSPAVSPLQKTAAIAFRNFLLAKENQEAAATDFGMRPVKPEAGGAMNSWDKTLANPSIDIKAQMPLPDVDVDLAIAALWVQKKRQGDLMILIDDSGSMSNERAYRNRDGYKIDEARDAGKKFLEKMAKENNIRIAIRTFHNGQLPDSLALTPLDSKSLPPFEDFVGSVQAGGGTPLYHDINLLVDQLKSQCDAKHSSGILVMTDGGDSDGISPDAILEKIRLNPDIDKGCNVRVFTIGLGLFAGMSDDNVRYDAALRPFAEMTGGLHYTADEVERKGLSAVFEEIGFFF